MVLILKGRSDYRKLIVYLKKIEMFFTATKDELNR